MGEIKHPYDLRIATGLLALVLAERLAGHYFPTSCGPCFAPRKNFALKLRARIGDPVADDLNVSGTQFLAIKCIVLRKNNTEVGWADKPVAEPASSRRG